MKSFKAKVNEKMRGREYISINKFLGIKASLPNEILKLPAKKKKNYIRRELGKSA